MELEKIALRKNRIKKSKRLGRGYGSGVGGHTVGRGTKGQKSRAGHKSLQFFEGGNVPFFRRMPKYKGFNRKFKIEAEVVSIGTLDKHFESEDTITSETLKKKGIVRKNASKIKILGNGETKKKFILENLELSKTAKEKLEKAGAVLK